MEYDPDRIVQHYYKNISESRLLLTALKDTVSDAEVMRNAYATFEKHIDLKEACRDWNRDNGTTRGEMQKII